MRILIFSPYYNPYISGLTVYLSRMINHLKIHNSVTILTFSKAKQETKKNDAAARIIRMPYLCKISKGFISPPSLWYFIRHLPQSDTVCINLPNVEGFALTLIARVMHKKIVSIYHCSVSLPPSPFLWLAEKTVNIFTRLQMELSTSIITNEDYFKNLDFPIFVKKKAKYIFPPIISFEPDKTKLAELKMQKKDKKWIGFAGRVSSEKGIEYLIQAIEKLPNTELVIAGPDKTKIAGEKKYFQMVKDRLAQFHVPYRYFENLTDQQMVSFYKTIDILVLPSINQTEAFGMVQAEAMLSGTPVIATNLPGVRMPIRLTKMGILVSPKDTGQITTAIKEILEHKSKYTNDILVANARRIFSIDQTYSFYDKLVAS